MKRATLGMILILLGTLLLLNIFEILTLPSWEQFWSYWPIVLFVIGIFFLVQGDTSFISFFLILLGAVYSLRLFEIYPFTLHEVIWPSVLISAGISFVLSGSLSSTRRRRHGFSSDTPSEPGKKAQRNPRNTDVVDESVVLSGKEFAVFSDNFRGGELSVMLGGMEVDLRHVKMTESATLFLRCTLGGLEVYLPPDIQVRVSGSEILGGADTHLRPESAEMTGPVLMIDYQVTLGGIEIIQ